MFNYDNFQQLKQKEIDSHNKIYNIKDDINSELIEKNELIKNQYNKIQSLNMIIDNLKLNTNSLHEKLSEYEILKINSNANLKKLIDAESEIDDISKENLELKNIIKEQENIINEFNKYIEITDGKFINFDKSNQKIRNENEDLKRNIYQIEQKLHKNYDILQKKDEDINKLINEKLELEKIISSMKVEIIQNDDKIRSIYEDKELDNKTRLKEREEKLQSYYLSEINKLNVELEGLRYDHEKSILENKNLRRMNDDLENLIEDKENDFKRVFELKDEEYQKLHKTLKDLMEDIKDFENNYNQKNSDMVHKLKEYEENEHNLNEQIVIKNKKINHLEDELIKCRNNMKNMDNKLQENEFIIETKDKAIQGLNIENHELNKLLSDKDNQLELFEEKKSIEFNSLMKKIKNMMDEKENLNQVIDEYKVSLEEACNKIRELKIYIDHNLNNKEDLNENIMKDNEFRKILYQYERNEENLMKELDEQKEIINNKDNQLNNSVLKYENIIHRLTIENDELKFCKNVLVEEITSIKSMIIELEKMIINGKVINSNPLINNFKIAPNESYHMNNMKDFIYKIDDRIKENKILFKDNLDEEPRRHSD